MISVCIPVYNYDVTEFVTQLSNQADAMPDFEIEILIIDDCSDEVFKQKNAKLSAINHVKYEELQSNLGRSKARNYLADKAIGDSLIVLDCDAACPDDLFLNRFANYKGRAQVIYGGRKYFDTLDDDQFLLRWVTGKDREEFDAVERNLSPYRSFMTNNFLIKKSVYQSVKMDETIVGYGHEDTLFAIELEKHGIIIDHIDNPLIHVGLETADEFLEKTDNALVNLKDLTNRGLITDQVKLHNFYSAKSGLVKLALRVFVSVGGKKWIAQKLKAQPSPKLFDWYKLLGYAEIG